MKSSVYVLPPEISDRKMRNGMGESGGLVHHVCLRDLDMSPLGVSVPSSVRLLVLLGMQLVVAGSPDRCLVMRYGCANLIEMRPMLNVTGQTTFVEHDQRDLLHVCLEGHNYHAQMSPWSRGREGLAIVIYDLLFRNPLFPGCRNRGHRGVLAKYLHE
jgi:hypothetical protein